MDLAPELRLLIYADYAQMHPPWIPPDPSSKNATGLSSAPSPYTGVEASGLALLQVSQQVRLEASPVIYGNARFVAEGVLNWALGHDALLQYFPRGVHHVIGIMMVVSEAFRRIATALPPEHLQCVRQLDIYNTCSLVMLIRCARVAALAP